MALVHKGKTDKYPKGLAHLIVKELKKKYAPQDDMSQVEMSNALKKVKMKKRDDPVELTEQLHTIANTYKTKTYVVPPRELLTTMIGAAPKEYASTIRDAQRLHGSNLNINLLEEEMRAYWQIAYGSSTTQDDDDEIALAVPQLQCYNCNAIGHRL